MATIGIDLGTTNSLAAYWTGSGPQLIPNAFGKHLTPSIVSVDDNGEILVGDIAKERLITHPHLAAAAFKRFMGTKKEYHLGRYSFLPEELSSFVLKSLKSDAEAFLGEPVEEAIVSVPAYFNDMQRKATKNAAELAGLKVERLISEPTAAALSYGIHRLDTDTKFLVFDLGGGTFGVSILELFDGVIEVKAISGENFLGGEDFTDLLVSYFFETQGLDKEGADLKTRSAVYKQAELCKYALSESTYGNMNVVIKGKNLKLDIDRSCFESLAGQLLLRIRSTVERALRDSSLSPESIDAIVLVGGASRMSLIRSAVGKIFGKIPFSSVNPDEAIALGTAVQLALKERNADVGEIILTDVCPYTLGTNVSKAMERNQYESGFFLPIIERNTTIPVSKVERLYTVSNNQTKICIEVYQGEDRKVEDNILLGELNINIPLAPAGEQCVDIRYTYDINGILEVEAVVVKTGDKERLVIENNPGMLTEKEIEERLKALESIKIHPREKSENRLLLARGERLFEELLGERRAYIGELLTQFDRLLSQQNESDIKKGAKKLKMCLDELERKVDFE